MNDQLKALMDKENEKLCQHEAAHAVCAYYLGFTCLGCKIGNREGHLQRGEAEINLFLPAGGLNAVLNYLNNRIIVLYAGILGEHFIECEYNGDKAEEFFKTDGCSDKTKLTELLRVLANITCDEQSQYAEHLKSHADRLITTSLELVRKHKRAIICVRDELMKRINRDDDYAELDQADIERCIKQAT